MQGATFEQYPPWMVAVCSGVGLTIYAIGLGLVAQLGPVWAAAYAVYCAWVEWRVLAASCRNCWYYGKRCAFGKGRVCAWLLRRGDGQAFCDRRITCRDVAPDLLVALMPLAAGIAVLVRGFSWPILLLTAALVALASAGNGFVRGKLACAHCRQRELGCPAEQPFRKATQP
jgi:hypothetical protein